MAAEGSLRVNFYAGSSSDREPFALLHGRH
jgi:hypothetical protein